MDYRGIISTLFSQRWHNCFETRQTFSVYYLAGSVFLAGSHAEMCLVLIDSRGQHCRSQVGSANPGRARQKQAAVLYSSEAETRASGNRRHFASRQLTLRNSTLYSTLAPLCKQPTAARAVRCGKQCVFVIFLMQREARGWYPCTKDHI